MKTEKININKNRYYRVSIKKLILLNLLTLSLYSAYWWYKNFEYNIGQQNQQKKEKKTLLYAILLTPFSPLLCFWIFNNIAKEADKINIRSHWDPLIISVLYQTSIAIFLLFCFEYLDHTLFIFFGLYSFLALIPVQMTCNTLHNNQCYA